MKWCPLMFMDFRRMTAPDGFSDLVVAGWAVIQEGFIPFRWQAEESKLPSALFIQMLHCLRRWYLRLSPMLRDAWSEERGLSLKDVSVSHYGGTVLAETPGLPYIYFVTVESLSCSTRCSALINQNPGSWFPFCSRLANWPWVNQSGSKLSICKLGIRTLFPFLSKGR